MHVQTHSRGAVLVPVVTLGVTLGLAVASTSAADTPPRRLTVDELVRRAITSPRAEMARQESRAAEARSREARAARIARIELTSFVAPSPDIACDNAECTRTTPTEISLALQGVYGGVRLSAVQPIYTFGKLDAVSRAAGAAARATGLLERAVAGDLAVEAARAYYGLKLARELVWMLEDGLIEIDKALAAIVERLEDGTGEATVQDRLRVQTLRAEVLARLSEARQARAIALAGVRALAGDDSIDIDEAPLEIVALELGPSTAYVARAKRERSEVAAARMGAKAAGAQEALERAQYWPNLVLVGQLEWAGAQGVDDPPTVFAHDPFNTTSAAVAVALRWNIDPATQRARVAWAEARRRQAEALVTLADRVAGFEAERAHVEALEAQARLTAAEEGEKSARGWVAAVLQADAVGAAEAKDLGDAFIAYFTLRSRYVTSVYEWNLAVWRLRRASGEDAVEATIRH